ACRHVERGLGYAGRRRRDIDAPTIQAGERDLESLAFRSDLVRGRNLTLIEDQLAQGRGMQPHLALQLADAEAWGSQLDDESRDAARALLASAREDNVEVRDTRVRHPELRAVEDVAFILASCSAAQASHV